MTGYESKKAMAQDKVTDIDGHVVRDVRKPRKLPQRPWVGLTEKEKKEIYRLSVYVEGAISLTEAKLKEKNNG